MRPESRSFLAPPRLDCVRGNAFNGTDFIFYYHPARHPIQLVRPPLNSNSEVTDELLLIRLIASPSKLATDKVTTFIPSMAWRRTVSVVINSSISDFRNLSMPTSFKIAWETHASIFFAPFFFS